MQKVNVNIAVQNTLKEALPAAALRITTFSIHATCTIIEHLHAEPRRSGRSIHRQGFKWRRTSIVSERNGRRGL